VLAEDVVAERAVAERGDEAWLGHRVVGGQQWARHACGDCSCDEEDVGVSWGGDDVEAVALDVVEWVGGGAEFVFAAVARACVDVADRERERAPARECRVVANRGELAQKHEHQRSTQA
jgi:hypothetical protein